jgi:hypothetical protein
MKSAPLLRAKSAKRVTRTDAIRGYWNLYMRSP